MEIDGWLMLIFDKYYGDHSYTNKVTINMTVEKLFASNYTQLYGNTALDNFNKFNNFDKFHYIPPLDEEFYQVFLFISNIDIQEKYLIIGININKIKDSFLNKKVIPNEDILHKLFHYNYNYENKFKYMQCVNDFLNTTTELYKHHITNEHCNNDFINKIISILIKNILINTGDITDKFIIQPSFLTINLYNFQKRTIKWMLDKEINDETIYLDIKKKFLTNDIYYDIYNKIFIIDSDGTKIKFHGGALIDDVGLGKTIQMITLSLLNPFKMKPYIDIQNKKIYSKATLIICPTQLCNQWYNEITTKIRQNQQIKVISLLTKKNYDTISYKDIMEADFVIISYSYLNNKIFTNFLNNKIFSKFMKDRKCEYMKKYDKNLIKNEFDAIDISNKSFIMQHNVQLLLIHWHRILIDEFHEIVTIKKYSYMKYIIPLFNSTYKWCITATPFNNEVEKKINKTNKVINNNDDNDNDDDINYNYIIHESFYMMFDFITNYTNKYKEQIFLEKKIQEYLSYSFFRRNTKESITNEYKLPPLKESIIMLNFSRSERMIYHSYIINDTNDKKNIFLQKLCCHPKLMEEIKNLSNNCKSLEEIESIMITHYKKMVTNIEKEIEKMNKIIDNQLKKINMYEIKKLKTLLKKTYHVSIAGITDEDRIHYEINDNDNDNDNENNKKKIVIYPTDVKKIIKDYKLEYEWEKNKITLDDMYDVLYTYKEKLNDINKIYEGNKATLNFYNNVLKKLKSNENNEETCPICLDNIFDNNRGITICGHLYCYECIMELLKKNNNKCSYCKKNISFDNIYKISYVQNNNETGKSALINKIGTKLANLIYYIKGNDKHRIIFSQWDDLLHYVGDTLNQYGIRHTYCRGNIWQQNKAIRDFNTDIDTKIIMLSSTCVASGINLTKATEVILLDPIYGPYEYRINTEWQAIGRAYRIGQTKEVTVVRFIIKDSIEEDIYKENVIENNKYDNSNNKLIYETTDESVILSKDKIKEIEKYEETINNNNIELSKKRIKLMTEKILKGKKK